MRLPFQKTLTSTKVAEETMPIAREQILGWVGITLIVILAAALRFANLDSIGYANHYYTAAVQSMLQSWHNFFFVAAEPGGAVSVDKPPLGLWIQVVSAYFLGVSGFSVVLPQIMAGILSVIVLYHLVKRSFGTVAGLIAALALAITPIVIATDRNNTMDSTLILTLLLAAWAFIKATETHKMRYLLLGAVLMGLGFNIKMLQAFLPLPAFYALYLFGSPETFRSKVGRLALASVLLIVVAFSWAIAVDLTPAGERPYVGSSGDNSEMSLIFGYNGVNRLLGMMRGGSPNNQPVNGRTPAQGPDQNGGLLPPGGGLPSQRQNQNGAFQPPASNGSGNGAPSTRPPLNGSGTPQGNRPPGMQNNGQRPSGGMNLGQAGPFRLFTLPLSKETSWLLPFGIVTMLLLVFGSRWRWTVGPKHQTFLLWGGWLITAGVFFSVAGFFHEYYLSMMGAPLAALVGIGVVELWKLREKNFRLATGLALGSVGITLAFQYWTAHSFTNDLWWMILAFAAYGAGSIVVLATSVHRRLVPSLGYSFLVISMLVTPGAWSILTTTNSSANQSLPAAYTGQSSGPANRGNTITNDALLNFLQTNTQGMKYMLAVPSSMQGADYVIATGRPVLYMGGFNGQDDVVSTDELSQLVNNGELRYVYWGTDPQSDGKSDISSWVTSSCQVVRGFDTATRNAGAPDGTGVGANTSNSTQNTDGGPGRNIQVTLYDCGT